jgi:hypothetical protein
MTLDEARQNFGSKVIRISGHTPAEEGVITSVDDWYVFVRYGSRVTSQATSPSQLWLLVGGVS